MTVSPTESFSRGATAINVTSESGEICRDREANIASFHGTHMMQTFQLVGIDPTPFERLFNLSDEQLKAHAAQRLFADESPGYPCRISLQDAILGEELLLLPYTHQPVNSPYRSSGPIFVRKGVKQRTLPAGEVPGYVTRRLISVRAYDVDDAIVAANVCEGVATADAINKYFQQPQVAYIHLHNANRGCFSCRVERV
jgi:hypothetical protein